MAYKKYGYWGSHVEGGYTWDEINAAKKKVQAAYKKSKFIGTVGADGTYYQSFKPQTKKQYKMAALKKAVVL